MCDGGEVYCENFPEDFKKLNRWCVRKKKIPYCPTTGKNLKTNEPDTWASFDDANSTNDCSFDWDGVGFVFSSDDGFVAIDLDDCFADDKILKPWAANVTKYFKVGYMEHSPSGNGLHIIVRGKKPGTECKYTVKDKKGVVHGKVEIYEDNRYFTMTGRLYDGRHNVPTEEQQAIDELYKNCFGEKGITKESGAGSSSEFKPPAPGNATVCKEILTTEEIISLIEGSEQGEKFKLLVNGPLESILAAYNNDHSAAVHALSSIIAWYTGSFATIDSIFKSTPLYVGKWAANEKSSGANREGKWQRTGRAGFSKLREGYEKAGNFYSVDCDRTTPEEDFSDSALKKEVKKGEKEYKRHVELLHEFGESRRDLLSGTLHYKNGKGEWEPVFTKGFIGALRGECQKRGKLYKKSNLEDYLHNYEHSLPPQLLIDVPLWDGEDRLGLMCSKLNIENTTKEVFEDIFKDWCAKLWQRIENPTKVQNLCILLSGAQGIGKDVWINSIFNSLGQYYSDLVLDGKYTKESDLGVVLGRSLVLFISEFEKTESLDVGTLKDIITKSTYTAVRKYDRDASTLTNRCSVIGACNPAHVFRDVTGNRRFIFFRLSGKPGEAIDWDYPVMDQEFSLQCIAQIKALGESNYRASKASWKIITDEQEESTPDDPIMDIVIDFESAIQDKIKHDICLNNGGLYRLHEISDILADLAKNHGAPRNKILQMLRKGGCRYRNMTARFYGLRSTCANGVAILAGNTTKDDDEETDTQLIM